MTNELDSNPPKIIISLGYRINSKVATRFRQWATARLLTDAGKVRHEQAIEKTESEYVKYQARTPNV